MHIVIAVPCRVNMPLDPNWYTDKFIDYIKNLLPSAHSVSSYYVSFANLEQFFDDMAKMHAEHDKVCLMNFCDGGEWDGYPGVTVIKKWEKHPLCPLVHMTGADSAFVFNSDDKMLMNTHLQKAGLKAAPQLLVTPEMLKAKTDFTALLVKEGLDTCWPLFCKLNIGAAALGINSNSVCHNLLDLVAQMKKMHEQFPISNLLVQPYFPGPEYTILVVKDKVYASIRRDFHNKFNLMDEHYLLDADKIDDEITYLPAAQAAGLLAVKAIQAIPGKHHYTRVDLREDGKGNIFVLDINDRPGLGDPSTIKCMLDFNHLSERQLLADLIDTCVL